MTAMVTYTGRLTLPRGAQIRPYAHALIYRICRDPVVRDDLRCGSAGGPVADSDELL